MITLFSCCTSHGLSPQEHNRINGLAERFRAEVVVCAEWASGYGAITHDALTQVRIHDMLLAMVETGKIPNLATGYHRLMAADKIASAGMWLVAHMTYAQRVYTDGQALKASDFKLSPEGHTGGSLNMVPAYAACLAMNALDGQTRSWMMGQGHCVAAIDALNVIVGNMTDAHASRYSLSDLGLSRMVSDFYSFEIRPNGRPASPLGSHVNVNTAGGMQEGGYLGFTELH